jgi:hypothetical protein
MLRAVAELLILPDIRHNPGLSHLLPQVSELRRWFAGRLSPFAAHHGLLMS